MARKDNLGATRLEVIGVWYQRIDLCASNVEIAQDMWIPTLEGYTIFAEKHARLAITPAPSLVIALVVVLVLVLILVLVIVVEVVVEVVVVESETTILKTIGVGEGETRIALGEEAVGKIL